MIEVTHQTRVDSGQFKPPYAIRSFLCKIASRCNLDCDYCYVYKYFDTAWKTQPRVMSFETVRKLTQRIKEYVAAENIGEIEIIFHGGEPLLAGEDFIKDFVKHVRGELEHETELRFTIQTNATLLNEQVLDTLKDLGVSVSVSLDGDEIAHNRHRRFFNGKGSFEQVSKGLSLLATKYHEIFAGILAVVDLHNDPVDVYKHLLSYKPTLIDFLLPDANYDKLPPNYVLEGNSTPYADWLIRVFDAWYGFESHTTIRTFESIIAMTIGGWSWQDNLGQGEINLLAIETDGSYHDLDVLRALVPNEASFGMNVWDHSIADVLKSEKLYRHHLSIQLDGLSEQCKQCPLVEICGSGYYPHRYSSQRGFDNPSVYCRDLFKLISYVSERVKDELQTLSQ